MDLFLHVCKSCFIPCMECSSFLGCLYVFFVRRLSESVWTEWFLTTVLRGGGEGHPSCVQVLVPRGGASAETSGSRLLGCCFPEVVPGRVVLRGEAPEQPCGRLVSLKLQCPPGRSQNTPA